MAETPALPWLLNACEKAGKGTINNMDARAVLRAIKEAERAAVEAMQERIAKMVALQNGPGRGKWIVPLVERIRALDKERIRCTCGRPDGPYAEYEMSACAVHGLGKEQNPA